MKEITTHEADIDHKTLTIFAELHDKIGVGVRYGAFDTANGHQVGLVAFQDGTLPDNGVNGVTIEALLAICKDRLEDFQASEYACGSNARALECINDALEQLHDRTLERRARGVEGTNRV